MARRIGYKRLSSVEVDPEASHQHEFHAGALRTQLGFGPGRTSGRLTVAIYLSDDPGEPLLAESTFTLYDARKPPRSEYRLYYDTAVFREAEAGDLLVLFSEDGSSLSALVARAGTRVERDLLEALGSPSDELLERFRFVAPLPLAPAATRELASALASAPAIPTDYPSVMAEFVGSAAASGAVPGTREMAAAATDAVAKVHGRMGPDLRIFHGLEAETDIYFAIENAVHGARLKELQARGADLTEVSAFVMGLLQSRKSRRGLSLQNHFARLLDDEGVPYTAQCETERGETPDFVMPSCAAYHDPRFPEVRLRMVACKSTSRERWRQVLTEAERVPEKYLLTLDRGLTRELVGAMRRARLRPFLPAPVISEIYPDFGDNLGTVGELLEELTTMR